MHCGAMLKVEKLFEELQVPAVQVKCSLSVLPQHRWRVQTLPLEDLKTGQEVKGAAFEAVPKVPTLQTFAGGSLWLAGAVRNEQASRSKTAGACAGSCSASILDCFFASHCTKYVCS